jgi:hypothetical protein
VRASIWDGKTVEMKRFTGAPEQRTRELSSLQSHLDWGGRHTKWQQYPRMVLSVIEETRRIPRDPAGHLPGWRVRDQEAFEGLTEEQLRAYVRRFGN